MKAHPNGSSSVGRRLLVLMILASLLIAALIWMSIYLFDAGNHLGFDGFGILTHEINDLMFLVAPVAALV